MKWHSLSLVTSKLTHYRTMHVEYAYKIKFMNKLYHHKHLKIYKFHFPSFLFKFIPIFIFVIIENPYEADPENENIKRKQCQSNQNPDLHPSPIPFP